MAKFSPAISSLKNVTSTRCFSVLYTSEPNISEIRKEKKNFFFTKFRNHRNAAVKSEIESAICWEFVLFSIQRLKSMYF